MLGIPLCCVADKLVLLHYQHSFRVGIATRYGLGGPGIESLWGRDFLPTSMTALGPTQPPIQRVLGLSRG
jgi:hypothetical protein